MSRSIDWKKSSKLLLYGLPLLVYVLCAIPMGYMHREWMNADAMCYIRRAGYLLHGDFHNFVSGHWSLMISWLIAPLVAMKIDGLYAARFVCGCIGAVYLLLFIRLSERLLLSRWESRLVLAIALAPFIATVAMRTITPDQLLAAWLMLYFLMVLNPEFPRSPRRQFLAGIVGGFAYLAKAFAFPFVIAHLLMTLVLYAFKDCESSWGSKLRWVAFAYGRGLVGFFLIASFWIAAISLKYGQLSFGSAGAAAHGVTGGPLGVQSPGEAMRANFSVPPGPYVSPFETPEKLFPHWSPFASERNFRFQLRVIQLHAPILRQYLSGIARLHAVPIVLALAIGLLPFRSPQRWRIAWLLLTLAMFIGPFLVVVIQHRYIDPHFVPLAMLLCMIVALEWRRGKSGSQEGEAAVPMRWWRAALAWVIIGLFLWSTIQWMRPVFKKASPVYRQLAGQLRAKGLSGPFVCESRSRGILVAYHKQDKFAGFPMTRDVAAADKMIREAGVSYMVIFDNARGDEVAITSPGIVQRPGWNFVLETRSALVYRLGGPPATTQPSRTIGGSSANDDDAPQDMDDGQPQNQPPEKLKPQNRQPRSKKPAR